MFSLIFNGKNVKISLHLWKNKVNKAKILDIPEYIRYTFVNTGKKHETDNIVLCLRYTCNMI